LRDGITLRNMAARRDPKHGAFGAKAMQSMKYVALVCGVMAAVLFTPMTAKATGISPCGCGDLNYPLANINIEISKLNLLNNIHINNIRLVNVNNVLNHSQLEALNVALTDPVLNIQIANLRNVLSGKQVLSGNQLILLTDFLNQNNVKIFQVIAILVDSSKGLVTIYHL